MGTWTGLIWFRIGTGGGHVWLPQWTLGFHKMRGNSWLAEGLSASQEGLCSMEKVNEWRTDCASFLSAVMLSDPELQPWSQHEWWNRSAAWFGVTCLKRERGLQSANNCLHDRYWYSDLFRRLFSAKWQLLVTRSDRKLKGKEEMKQKFCRFGPPGWNTWFLLPGDTLTCTV
jgi:hypothetical protein